MKLLGDESQSPILLRSSRQGDPVLQEGISIREWLVGVQDELLGDVVPWAGEGARVLLDAKFHIVSGKVASDAEDHVRRGGLIDDEFFDFEINEPFARKRSIWSTALRVFSEEADFVVVIVEIWIV